jgi:hypothetical protein
MTIARRLLTVLLLSVCGAALAAVDGPYGSKSVAWYMAHKDARVTQLNWCQEQSADMQMQSRGCAQAGVAAQKAWLNSGRNYVSGN